MILHVTDVYLPGCGGIEHHVHDLAAQQQARACRVLVATCAREGRSPSGPPHRGRTAGSLASPEVVRLPARDLRGLMTSRPVSAVHVHASVWSPFALAGLRAAVDAGLPVVVTVHSMWDGLGALPRLGAQTLGLADPRVVWSAVSRSAATTVGRAFGDRVPVHVLPNAVDVSAWAPQPTSSPAVATSPTVISVMRLTRRKRAMPLVSILRDVREQLPGHLPLRAVVVGDGRQRAVLAAALRAHRLDGVELTGRLDAQAIRERLRTASVFLAPATRESFGIAALEARTAGLPVVASTHGGVNEFVRDGVEGLLAPDDAGLAHAVARLLTDDGLRERIAAHNRSTGPTCSWDVTCRAAADLYATAARLASSQAPRLSDARAAS